MSTWQCGKCGFNNRPGNNVCGGTGSLGCKQPRPDRQVDLGSRALAEADMVQDLERRLLLESLGLDEGYRAPPPDPAIAAVFKGNQQIPVPEAFPPDILPPSIFTTKAATFAEPRSPPPAPTEAQSSLSPSFLPAEAPAVSAASGASGAGVEWLCRCGFRNRASNSTCGGTGHLGCSLPKHVGQIDEREGSQPLPVPSTGIWQCLHCGFRNRPTNSICGGTGAMGCSALRPDLEPRKPENAPRTVPPVRTDAVATGAWVCGSCGFKNHAGNDKCGGIGPLGCKEPRVGPGQEKDSEPVKETEPWLCSACDSKNEGSEMLFCSSCQAPRRFTGVLKSIGGDYAFVACTETAAAYGRDVYVSKAILHHAFCRGGAATSGISVSFMIALNDAGQPNVRHLLPLNRGTGMEDHDFEGTVKYLSEEKGFGFVECQEIMDMYGGDAHADYSFLKSCSLGQPVTFLIRLGQIGGRPQVTKLSISGPPPAMLPATSESVAAEVVADAWQGRVLLLGEGDFTFASAAAVLHQDSAIDATTVLEEEQWKERYPNHVDMVDGLRKLGHDARFGVDARQVNCANYSMVIFNFPAVAMQDCTDLKPEKAGSISGELALDFLKNAQATSDLGTLLVLGLWGRCDGQPDKRLYGQDSHELVASAIAEGTRCLEDALRVGFVRSGVHADYNFYKPYTEEGYAFRSTSGAAAFESSHKEWHLQGCFVLRVVAADQKISAVLLEGAPGIC